MSSSSLGSAVARNTNDIADIYELLAGLKLGQRRQATRLTKFMKVTEERFDGIDGRLEGIDGRLEGIDGRLDGIDGRLDGVDGRLDGIDGRLDEISTHLAQVVGIVVRLEEKVDRLADGG